MSITELSLASNVSLLTKIGNELTIENTGLCQDDVDALRAQLLSLGGAYTASDNMGVCPSCRWS